jgi:NAD(P)-dependent dehydrogenase (short-subunit alcohol dehydrogenase family)
MDKQNDTKGKLAGKVALVTGAGSGIGRAAAFRMAKEGAKIGTLDRDINDLKDISRELQDQGAEAISLAADISNPQEMQEATKKLVDRFGRIDIVFANAGINGVWAPIEELSPEDWDRTLNNNLKGTFLTVKYTVPYLKRQGGSVIVTSSVNGTRIFSNTGATAYSCSKAGQVAFSKMIALELAKHHIRVNVICPGAISTQIEQSTEKRNVDKVKAPVNFPEGSIPLTGGKPGTTEQVADLVLFLASDDSNHITGTEIWIDGGSSLLVG